MVAIVVTVRLASTDETVERLPRWLEVTTISVPSGRATPPPLR